MNLIDLEGLTYGNDAEEFATALNLQGKRIQRADRLSYLARLKAGSGATVFTGPTGAPFWLLVSPEVRVRVVPDEYDYKPRTTDLNEWSLLAVGCTRAEVRELQAREYVVGPKHRLYAKHVSAEVQRKELQRLLSLHESSQSIIDSSAPAVTILKEIGEQLTLIGNLPSDAAVDLEWTTDGNERLIGINVSNADSNWYLPYLADGIDNSHYARAALQTLAGGVRTKGFVWHNAKADFKLLAHDPITLFGSPAHDTILAAYVAGYQSLGLKELSAEVLGRHATPLPVALETLPVEVAARYGAAGDSRNTYDLFEVLKKKLHETNQWYIYNDIERPLVPMVSSMEKFGFPVDHDEVVRLRDEFARVEEALVAHVWSKQRLDLRDYKQQREFVKRMHGYDLGTLDQNVLARIPDAWMDTLIGYRKVVKLRNDFLDKHAKNQSGSVYPRFNQAGRDTGGAWISAPATGRFSSAEPNLQNQPRELRSIFIAPEGHRLVVLDYKGLELYVAAALSEDPVMLSVLQAGGDLHNYMRQRIKELTGKDVGRPASKTGNFNALYGGREDMMMTITAKERAPLSYELAKGLVDAHHSTYKGYWQWFDGIVDLSRKTGYSETLLGRRRYQDDLFSGDSVRRSHAERAAANMVVQGTAADIIKISMARLHPVIQAYAAHLAVQVHDELVFWVPEKAALAFKLAATAVMESIEIPHLRLKVEAGLGHRWSEAK